MRIGLLMHGADRPLTGVTRVAVELGRALERHPDCDPVFLVPYREGPFRTRGSRGSWYLPGCGRVPGLMLLGGPLTSIAARQLRLDLVHDPVGASPFTLGRSWGTFKRVLSIHDAIAFRYPEGYPPLNNFLHRHYVPFTLRNVDAVVTASEHARLDLERFLGLPPPAVHVTPLGVSDDFHPVEASESRRVAAAHGLSGPFVLSVGVKQERKNFARLIDAFAMLHARLPAFRLALVGPTLWRYRPLIDAISAHGLQDYVRLIEYVSDPDLRALYNGSSLFIFPSLYEGFGLPALEAMACGTPVVSSDATSLPEVVGDAAVLIDPIDVPAMADAMERVLVDSDLRKDLQAKGFARARSFTWDRAAESLMATYRAVLADGGDPAGSIRR